MSLIDFSGPQGSPGGPAIRLRCGVRYPDIAIEERELLIELNGRAHHTRVRDFDRNHLRHNDFVREGRTVLRCTAQQVVQQPQGFVETTRERIEAIRRSRACRSRAGRLPFNQGKHIANRSQTLVP